MTIKIYGFAEYTYSGPVEGIVSPATATARVLATLFEKEVTDFEIVKVNFLAGEQKKPEFLALQPFGIIPAMVDGSLTLIESRAIARFIAHKFKGQGTPLYGSNPKDKALVEQWLEVEGQNYNPPISTIIWEELFKVWGGGVTKQAVVDANVEKLDKVLEVYEAHLSKSKYLAGDFFSLADLSHIPYTYFLVNVAKRGVLIETRPLVKAWWNDISSRPFWKKIIELATHN